MRDTLVKLKDGTEFCSPLWEFHPKEGWLMLVDGDPIYLRDIESAIDKDVWVRWNLIQDVDLLDRARREGWDGT